MTHPRFAARQERVLLAVEGERHAAYLAALDGLAALATFLDGHAERGAERLTATIDAAEAAIRDHYVGRIDRRQMNNDV